MSDNENENRGFVVKDKRRFDSSGNEKSEASSAEKSPAQGTAEIKKQAITESSKTDYDNSGQATDPQEMNFSSFVMSLATQALMQLGEIQPPPGINMEIDKSAARQSIDILGMIQQKTKNNLDKDEEHLLEQILHNLRLSYVKAVS